jgi:methylase of polypeptide subunit release factors
MNLDPADAALLELLRTLERRQYRFVTPTPETHGRVLARPPRAAPTLRDVFGWSRLFDEGQLDAELVSLLRKAGMLLEAEGGLKSGVRVSTLRGRYYLHSAFPTAEVDSVFFGPDSYRFAEFVCRELHRGEFGRLVDIGAGGGVGGLAAAGCAEVGELILTDINPKALRLARVNAAHAGVPVRTVETDSLDGLEGGFDIALANPPYIIDPEERSYRHGGDLHGGRLSLEMSEDALKALNPGGRLLLYTGAAIVEGRNALCEELARLCAANGASLRCEELDPDVFGEELSRPEYADVERIAVIGAVAQKRA